MSQESEKEINPLYVRLESAGVLEPFNLLLSKHSIGKELRVELEAVLNEHAPLSKKYHQGLIDLQRGYRISPDFVESLGELLAGVKTKTKVTSKKAAAKKVKSKKTVSKKVSNQKEQLPIKVTAEVAGPTKEGLVLKVVVPWSEIISNIPPELLSSITKPEEPSSAGGLESPPVKAGGTRERDFSKPDISDDDVLARYQSAVLDPSPESMWDQVLHLVTGSDKVSLDRVAERLGSDKETIRDFVQTAYGDIKKYVEIRLEGDHVSATYK